MYLVLWRRHHMVRLLPEHLQERVDDRLWLNWLLPEDVPDVMSRSVKLADRDRC